MNIDGLQGPYEIPEDPDDVLSGGYHESL